MRIIWITSKLDFETAGGSVEETDYIARNLQRLGHEVSIITAHSSRNKIPQELPYKVIPIELSSHRMLHMQYSAYKLLRAHQDEADFFIVDAHLFMYGAGLYRLLGGTPIAAFCNQFLTCWPQYESSFFPRAHTSSTARIRIVLRRALEKYIGMRLARAIDIFAFVNPNFRQMYENFGLRHRATDMVIGDPIDVRGLAKRAGVTEISYRKRLKKTGPIMLFYSSRMSPGKGFDVFLQGFARVKDKSNYRVILGGTGPEEKYVHAMARELGLMPYVEFPGWVSKEKLVEYYKTADIFIQADWWPAGSSISLLYALAFGVPSILPGGGGLQWNAGLSALYFPYRDVEALARCIEKLGIDADLRARLSEQCYVRLAQDDVNYPALIEEFARRLETFSNARKNAE